MKTVLVTGGAGFIGSALCRRLLAKGLRVVAFDDFSSHSHGYIDDLLANKRFVMIKVNINNLEVDDIYFKKYNFDTIYHFASNTSIPKGQDNIEIDIKNTFLSTISILRLAIKYNVKKFVFTSSSTVYGKADFAFNEESAMCPISFYGAAKMSSEAFINAFCTKYDLQSWIIRFCNIVGPHFERGVVSDIKRKIKAGEKMIHMLGDGNQEKPFLHIEDAIDGLLFVVNHATEKHNTYLVGNSGTITIKRITEIAKEEMQNDVLFLFDNTPTWSGDVLKYKFDISKVSQLGWQPKYTSEEAIRKSFK